jgi:hypothetical protein
LLISGNTTVKGTIYSNLRSNSIIVESGGNLTVSSGAYFNCFGIFNIGQSLLTANIESENINSGTLVIKGGAGISGNVNVGGNLTTKTFYCSGNSSVNGIVNCNNIIDSIKLGTGGLQVRGGSSIMGNIYVGGNIILSRQILVGPNISSSTVGVGSLIVVGGASISENCNIGGNTIIYGSTNNIPTIYFPISLPPTISTFTPAVPATSASQLSQIFTTTVSGQTYLNSYQNGVYNITTGSVAYNEYCGHYAIIAGQLPLKPWVTTRSYANIDHVPVVTLSNDTYVNGLRERGEWIEYSLPYTLTVKSYSLTLDEVSGNVVEAYPASWIIAGSVDGNTWTLIDNHIAASTEIVPTSAASPVTYQVLDNIVGYTHFRFIIKQVVFVSPSAKSAGSGFPGLYKISFNGIPSISRMTTSTGNLTTGTGNSTIGNLIVTVNPSRNFITDNTLNSNVIKTLMGPGTFAGAKSSLVVFGDSTIYGTHNVFENLNIVGNITNPTNSLNIISDVNIIGNLTSKNYTINAITGNATFGNITSNNISCNNTILGNSVVISKKLEVFDISCIARRGSKGIGGQEEGVGKGASLDYTKV